MKKELKKDLLKAIQNRRKFRRYWNLLGISYLIILIIFGVQTIINYLNNNSILIFILVCGFSLLVMVICIIFATINYETANIYQTILETKT
jgi:cellulose synthase/poly-beta-1,6-N-acetylglucosamine synthase-like glycosyltransferase